MSQPILDGKFFKSLLNIAFNKTNIRPTENQDPYSTGICIHIGEIKFNAWHCRQDDQQIISYNNNRGFAFIMKRMALYCDFGPDEKIYDLQNFLKIPEINSFIDHCLNEFFFLRLASAHPSGCLGFDFCFTYLISQKALVFELMMEDGGISLEKLSEDKKLLNLDFLKIFGQLINLMSFLESLKIIYSDVKLSNLLIDNKGILRVRNFDTTTSNMNELLGFTDGYAAPEVLLLAQSFMGNQNKPGRGINLSKADVYSCGIVGLILGRAIQSPSIRKVDQYKDSESNHQFILNLIEKVELNETTLTEKVKRILQACLDYNPDRRPTFNLLNNIFKNINILSLEEIEAKIRNELRSGKFTNLESIDEMEENQTRKQNNDLKLFKQIETYKAEIINLNEKITYIMDTLKTKENQVIDLNKRIEEMTGEKEEMFKEIQNNLSETLDPTNLATMIKKAFSNIRTKFLDEKSELFIQVRQICQMNNEVPPNSLSQIPEFINSLLQKNPMNKNKNKNPNANANPNPNLNPKVVPNPGLAIDKVPNKSPNKGPQITQEFLLKITQEKFWNFEGRNLKKEDILLLLDFIPQNKFLQAAVFYNNVEFDMNCADNYYHSILKSTSLIGIDLYSLKFPLEKKVEFIKLFGKKNNLKYIVLESQGISEKNAKMYAGAYKLEINNLNSKYYQFHFGNVTYYLPTPTWLSKIWFYSRE